MDLNKDQLAWISHAHTCARLETHLSAPSGTAQVSTRQRGALLKITPQANPEQDEQQRVASKPGGHASPQNKEKCGLAAMLHTEEFPLSSKYDPEWVLENQMGPNALWLTEWLCGEMDLQPGMRVLDMGCGMVMSSIFLAKEFGVQVWANDLWIPATDNWRRIREAGVEDRVFPIHAEAHALPYADEFFDAIVSLDSHHYYGTDDLYLKYFIQFLEPGGQIGVVVPGLLQDFTDGVPSYLTEKQRSGGVFWDPAECSSFHTVEWWRRHWEQTCLVDIEVADLMPDGWRFWLRFEQALEAWGKGPFPSDAEALEADQGRYLGFVRVIGRRKEVT